MQAYKNEGCWELEVGSIVYQPHSLTCRQTAPAYLYSALIRPYTLLLQTLLSRGWNTKLVSYLVHANHGTCSANHNLILTTNRYLGSRPDFNWFPKRHPKNARPFFG